jgi:hypothetical protein
MQAVRFHMDAENGKPASLPQVQELQMAGTEEGVEMMNEVTSINQSIQAFREAFASGINSITKAAEIYVRSLDENPRNADKFKDAFADQIPATAWSGFEAVGRKWMHPRLLMGGIANTKKSTIIKRLPYSLQERVFDRERFDLLCADGDKLQIDVMEATPEQAEQIFDGTSVRSLSAQKAYIEARKAKPEKTAAEVLPYTISAGKVFFRRGVSLTKGELKNILQAL